MKKAMVLAVHPDDETLGAGGTLLKLRDEGYELHWLIATEATADVFAQELIDERLHEIEQVASMYPFRQVHRLGFPTTRIEDECMAEVVGKLASVLRNVEPEILFVPYREDVHSDHRVMFNAAWSCSKSFRYPFLRRIYMMETLSETEFAPAISGLQFTPNSFVDITQYLQRKIEIMATFASEFGAPPFPRSAENIEALARLRGSSSGSNYAESFMLLKEYW